MRDDFSFAYVARWSDGATELIKDTAERVIGCAKTILEGLEADSPLVRETVLGPR